MTVFELPKGQKSLIGEEVLDHGTYDSNHPVSKEYHQLCKRVWDKDPSRHVRLVQELVSRYLSLKYGKNLFYLY
jgi:hypothetical protein